MTLLRIYQTEKCFKQIISKNETHISCPVDYSLKIFEIVKQKGSEGKRNVSQMPYTRRYSLVCTSEIVTIINKLKMTNSYGYDEIPVKILKNSTCYKAQ
jgi:hypothetical protein